MGNFTYLIDFPYGEIRVEVGGIAHSFRLKFSARNKLGRDKLSINLRKYILELKKRPFCCIIRGVYGAPGK